MQFDEKLFRPVSTSERAQAAPPGAPVAPAAPSPEAALAIDAQISEALADIDREKGGWRRYARQRHAYDARLLDALCALLCNCLRTMAAGGDNFAPSVDLTIQSFAHAPPAGAAAGVAASRPRARCSLGTLVEASRPTARPAAPPAAASGTPPPSSTTRQMSTVSDPPRPSPQAAEIAIAFLALVVRVEAKCEAPGLPLARQGAAPAAPGAAADAAASEGEWVQQVAALAHRRAMLLRIAECAAALLGRFAGDHDLHDQ